MVSANATPASAEAPTRIATASRRVDWVVELTRTSEARMSMPSTSRVHGRAACHCPTKPARNSPTTAIPRRTRAGASSQPNLRPTRGM